MKISVAMATYNGAQYIEEQLESIRIQTMPVDEVRICDDGSLDDTVEVICTTSESMGWRAAGLSR